MKYDYYEYNESDSGEILVSLTFKFEKDDAKGPRQKEAFRRLLFRALADLNKELGADPDK